MKLNEHDITKSMIDTLRAKSSNHKTIIKENEEVMTTDTDFRSELSGEDAEYFKQDSDAIRDIVDKGIKFLEFSVNRETENVTIGGTLSNGMEWSYSKECEGDKCIQIGTPSGERYVRFTQNTMKSLEMLYKYYDKWLSTWQDRFNEM
jgi:hypothetical protein